MGHRWGDLAFALGGWSGRREGITQKYVDGPRDKWKPKLAVLKAVIKFVKATRRFEPKALAEEVEV